MRFSASRLKAWMECQLAAKYRYQDNLPRRQNARASFGSVVHAALAEFYTSGGNYDRAVETFKRLWANPELIGVAPDYWPKYTGYASMRIRGLEILKRVNEAHKLQPFYFIGSEVGFLVPFGKHELTGFVDLVGTEKSGTGRELLQIYDFKTNMREPSAAGLSLDVQFTAYVYAATQREFWEGVEGNPEFNGVENGSWLFETIGRDMPKRAIWYSLQSGRRIDAGPRVQQDFKRLYRVCDEIERAVEAEVYVPKIGEACNWCDYQEPCALEIPVAVSGLRDKNDKSRWI